MAEDQEDEKLSQWLSGELSEEELRKFVSAEDILKYKQIIREVDNWTPSAAPFAWEGKQPQRAPTRILPLSAWVSYSVAASVALALAAIAWFLLAPHRFSYTNATSEVVVLALPDEGSEISLAPQATVKWEESDWPASRSLSAEGTVLLKVKKGAPFTVSTPQGTVEVLGTVFEVSEFGSGMLVNCYEGVVQAASKQGATLMVNAGEGFLLYNGQWEEKKVLIETAPSWLQNETRFSRAPLMQVIRKLEDLYEISVETGSINLERRFTGTIPHHKLDLALKIVFDPLGISYELRGDKLYLTE